MNEYVQNSCCKDITVLLRAGIEIHKSKFMNEYGQNSYYRDTTARLRAEINQIIDRSFFTWFHQLPFGDMSVLYSYLFCEYYSILNSIFLLCFNRFILEFSQRNLGILVIFYIIFSLFSNVHSSLCPAIPCRYLTFI